MQDSSQNMADLVATMKKGRDAWLLWRNTHPGVAPQLAEADLSGLDLSSFDLSASTLDRADLSRAKLTKANLSGATLRQTNLYDAHLHCADVRHADFQGADLREALIKEARTDGADFTDAKLQHLIWGSCGRPQHEIRDELKRQGQLKLPS